MAWWTALFLFTSLVDAGVYAGFMLILSIIIAIRETWIRRKP